MAKEIEAASDKSLSPAALAVPRWSWQRRHLPVLIFGILIRFLFAMSMDREATFGGWDGKEYYAYAQSLLALKWDNYPRYFNNIRPPFYPIFLTPFIAINDHVIWHIQLAQCLLGAAQVIILAKIAGRWAGKEAGNWAFIFAVFYPFFIYYPAFVLTETVFITLLWLGIACLQRSNDLTTGLRWLVGSALALGFACLTRPALQPFLAVAVFWIGWRMWQTQGWAVAFKRMGLFTILVSAILLPWMIGNRLVHGEFTLAPGGAVTAYALSNSPEYLRMYEAKTKEEYYQNSDRLAARFSVDSGISQETWMKEARDFRQNHSADWWLLQWYKFKHFWTPWLNPVIFSRANFLISLLANTPLFLLAGAELIRRRGKSDPFLVLLLGLVAVGYLVAGFLFHVQVRYRIPYVDVTFMLLTASLLGALASQRVFKTRIRELAKRRPYHSESSQGNQPRRLGRAIQQDMPSEEKSLSKAITHKMEVR